jgi:hypothetical protein
MMTFEETTTCLTRIANLQAQLLDYTGHVTRGMSRDDQRITLDEIQRLRESVGWPPLDMVGRYRRRPAIHAEEADDFASRTVL